MVHEQNVRDTIKSCNDGGRTKTFAEFIAEVFADKFIEIYLSDAYEEVSMEQISQTYPAVFIGKVVSAYRECLVIKAVVADKNNNPQLGSLMFLSERAIKGISELDGNGVIEDMFHRSKESLVVKTHLIDRAATNKRLQPRSKGK